MSEGDTEDVECGRGRELCVIEEEGIVVWKIVSNTMNDYASRIHILQKETNNLDKKLKIRPIKLTASIELVTISTLCVQSVFLAMTLILLHWKNIL